MSEQNKTKMVRLIERAVKVVEGEMNLLTQWSSNAQTSGRKTRCTVRKRRIQANSRSKAYSALQKARAIVASKVTNAPTSGHSDIIAPNEASLSTRTGWNVNALSDPSFTHALDRAEANGRNAREDAQKIFQHCTR